MSFCVSFSFEKAVAAGLKVDTIPVDDDRVSEAVAEGASPEYVDWLATPQTVVYVPNRDYCIDYSLSDDTMFVRANKWGETYAPLTQWLAEHNIEWGEG